jgi:hypothetical protein
MAFCEVREAADGGEEEGKCSTEWSVSGWQTSAAVGHRSHSKSISLSDHNPSAYSPERKGCLCHSKRSIRSSTPGEAINLCPNVSPHRKTSIVCGGGRVVLSRKMSPSSRPFCLPRPIVGWTFSRLTDQAVPGVNPSFQSRRNECCFLEDKVAVEAKWRCNLHLVTRFRIRSIFSNTR